MPTCPPKTDRERGFTLVEMLVVLTVVGIVAAMLAVSLRSEPGILQRSRAALALENSVTTARAKARSTGSEVFIIPAEIVPGAALAKPVFAGAGPNRLAVYPDGSTSGARIELAGAPLLDVGWLTGRVTRHD